LALLESLTPYVSNHEIIVIVDGQEGPDVAHLRDYACRFENVTVLANTGNEGLSACRNQGIACASNPYIIFFDDDVLLTSDIIARYCDLFSQGYTVIGGPLLLPASYPPPPRWLPRGLYSLLGIHAKEQKIWGGNFGFSRNRLDGAVPAFRRELGRRAGGLESGDDTTFIRELLRGRSASSHMFAADLAVEHHIDPGRYQVSYLARRSFWQGRSEVRRRAILAGLRKEAGRAFSVGCTGPLRAVRAFVGAGLLVCCLGGLIYEAALELSRKLRRTRGLG